MQAPFGDEWKIAANVPLDKVELKKTARDIKRNLSAMASLFTHGLDSFLKWMCGVNELALAGSVSPSFTTIFAARKVRASIRRRRRIRKCMEFIDRLQSRAISAKQASERIGICCRTVRELLDPAGLGRKRNMELFDYGASLEKTDHGLSKDVCAVFLIHSKASHGTIPPDERDFETSLQRLLQIRDRLQPRLGMP